MLVTRSIISELDDEDPRSHGESGVKVGHALVGGLLGAVAASALEIGARVAGVPIDFDLWLGRWFTADAEMALTLGVALQIALFTGVAVLYASGFERIARRGGWMVGLAFSLLHAAIAVALVAMLAPGAVGAEAPGSFPTVFSLSTTGVFVAMHVLYGIIVGWLYGERRARPRSLMPLAGRSDVGRPAASSGVDQHADVDTDTPRLSRRI